MTTPTATPSLDTLVTRARQAHESIQREPAAALTRAFEAGDALIAIKARLAHGVWAATLRRTTIPPSTARLYMQLARERARILAAGCTSIRQARRLLAGTKPRAARRGRAGGARAGRHARTGEAPPDRYQEGYADGYQAGRADGYAAGLATAKVRDQASRGRATPPPPEARDLRWLLTLVHPDKHQDDQTILRATRVTVWVNALLAQARQAA
jgi:hypothetical protein